MNNSGPKAGLFEGIWVPLVTPFSGSSGDTVDHPALTRLVKRLAAQGVAGFVAGGSTGEAALMSEAEQDAVLATVLDAAGGLPVVAGLSGARPQAVAARAAALGQRFALAALLVSAPAYVRPPQAGLLDHFRRIADAAPCPLMLYDIPARTGVRIDISTLLALAEHPNIVALKDCSGERQTAQAVLADGRLALLAGNDDELFGQLARGAAGGITASAHVAPAAFVQLHRLVATQQLPQARALWARLAPLTQALFAEPNPAPVKSWLAAQGLMGPALRAPLVPASAPTLAAAERAATAANEQP